MKHATLWLSIALSLGACDRPRAPTPAAQHLAGEAPTTQIVELPAQTVTLKGQPFALEIAATVDQQETGLMYRRSMPADHGMLFVFPQAKPQTFWMKNTLIPLDIAYVDADGFVLNVEKMYPLDLQGIRSEGDARYAIELNQGTAERIGLTRGDRLALPGGR